PRRQALPGHRRKFRNRRGITRRLGNRAREPNRYRSLTDFDSTSFEKPSQFAYRPKYALPRGQLRTPCRLRDLPKAFILKEPPEHRIPIALPQRFQRVIKHRQRLVPYSVFHFRRFHRHDLRRVALMFFTSRFRPSRRTTSVARRVIQPTG